MDHGIYAAQKEEITTYLLRDCPKTCIIMLSQAYYQFIGHLKTCMKLKYCHDAIAIMKCKDDEHRKSVCPVCG